MLFVTLIPVSSRCDLRYLCYMFAKTKRIMCLLLEITSVQAVGMS